MKAMTSQQDRVTSAILSALSQKTSVEKAPNVRDDEDIFNLLGLDSMQTFGVLVSLEKGLGIAIGVNDESEFDRVRTFGGLKALLTEKLAAQ